MTDKEKEEARFLMDGVTCDEQIEAAKKRIQNLCRQLKEEQENDKDNNSTDQH